MKDELTKQEQTFVKELVKTGNATQSVIEAYGETDENYAGVKGNRLIRKDKIINAIKSIADSLPDEDLIKVHKEGLNASKEVWKNNNESGEIEKVSEEPDYATRHKYLDSAYKLKGVYAPEKIKTEISLIPDSITKQTADEVIIAYLNANNTRDIKGN